MTGGNKGEMKGEMTNILKTKISINRDFLKDRRER
jgi:hypothetical protein